MNRISSTDVSMNVGSQSVTYYELFNYGPHRGRISIKSDSYDFQCHAHLDVFDKDNMKWNRVVYRPSASMETKSQLASKLKIKCPVSGQYKIPTSADDYAKDRAWLIKQFKTLMS